ncbi:MAG: hypothetical protein IJ493_02565 [Clostridia bacterium]|nr:hypothetical protein [Clostridia bacterium]
MLGQDDELWYDAGSGRTPYEGVLCVQGITTTSGVRVTGGDHKLLYADTEDRHHEVQICLSRPVFDIAAGASLTVQPGRFGGTASNCIGSIQTGEGKLIFGELHSGELKEKFNIRCGGETPLNVPDADDDLYERYYNYQPVLNCDERVEICETCWLVASDRSAWAYYDFDTATLTYHGELNVPELLVTKYALREREPEKRPIYYISSANAADHLLTVDSSMGQLKGRLLNSAWLSDSRDASSERDVRTLHLSGDAYIAENCKPDRVEMDGCTSIYIPERVTFDLSGLDKLPSIAHCEVNGVLVLPESAFETVNSLLSDGSIHPYYRGVVRVGKNHLFRAQAKLDFSKPDTPAEGEGYRWIAFTKTLVLTDFVCECADDCIRLPSRSTVELHGKSSITVTGKKSRAIAVGDQPRNIRGMLIFTGDGSLTLNGRLRVGNNDLFIRGGEIDLNSRIKTDSITLSGGRLTCRQEAEISFIELCGGEFMGYGKLTIGGLTMSRGVFAYESDGWQLNEFHSRPTLSTRCTEVNGCTCVREKGGRDNVFSIDGRPFHVTNGNYARQVKIIAK